MFDQSVLIDYCIHITGPVAKLFSESEYNAGRKYSNFSINFQYSKSLLFEKDPDMVTEQSLLIMLDTKSGICITNNGKYTKHTICIAIIINCERN